MRTLSRKFNGVLLIYEPEDAETADLIAGACQDSIRLIRESWGAEPQPGCRIEVMTSWLGFIFRAAPWAWRIPLALTFPFWSAHARRMWRYAAAWTQWYGRRAAIGVKPPRLLAQSDRRIGQRIYVEEQIAEVKIRNVTCHELVHASLARLRLPMWLNEGTALVTVDRFFAQQTIRQDTLELVKGFSSKGKPPSYRGLARSSVEVIAYQTVRGYWLTRFVEEVYPGLLRQLFVKGRHGKSIEREIIIAVGIQPGRFWNEIDDRVVQHFEQENRISTPANQEGTHDKTQP